MIKLRIRKDYYITIKQQFNNMEYQYFSRGDYYVVNHPKQLFQGVVTIEQGVRIQNGITYNELLEIFEPQVLRVEKLLEKRKELLEGLDKDVFEIVDNKVCVKGIPVGVPQLFLEEYKEALAHRKQALLNFWNFCCLNPDVEARDGLFRYIKESGLFITSTGEFIGYRKVTIKTDQYGNKMEGNRDLALAIGREYIKVKGWKKAPSNYFLVQMVEGDYTTIQKDKVNAGSSDYAVIGSLDSLYHNRSHYEETVYTWAHSSRGQGLETNEIRIGVPFKMDRLECDPNPSNDCSRGLHFTSWKHLSGYAVGDKTIAMLINPMNVVAVPYGYEGKKGRCCEYLPLAEITEEIVDAKDVFDYNYSSVALEQVNQMLKESKLYDGKEIMTLEEIPIIYANLESTLEDRRQLLEERYVDYYDDEEDLYDDEDDDLDW